MKIFLIVSFFLSQTLLANVAMPGIWNTGSGREFIPFFKEDSIHIGKVQMLSESIYVQLYKGYAVVKGSYNLVNRTNQNFALHLGFPINGSYEHPQFSNITYEELYSLKVFQNDSEVVVLPLKDYLSKNGRFEFSEDSIKKFSSSLATDDFLNWYVWETYFKAKDTLQVTVYYILNTNDSKYRKGYDIRHYNVFSYILETGEAWAGNIEEGEIRVQLMNGLNVSDVHGVYPFSSFMTNGLDLLVRKFTDFKPRPADNILIAYSEPHKEFNLNNVLSGSKKLYQKIETFSSQPFFEKNYFLFEKNDFEPSANFFTWLILGGIGALVIGGAIVYGIIRFVRG